MKPPYQAPSALLRMPSTPAIFIVSTSIHIQNPIITPPPYPPNGDHKGSRPLLLILGLRPLSDILLYPLIVVELSPFSPPSSTNHYCPDSLSMAPIPQNLNRGLLLAIAYITHAIRGESPSLAFRISDDSSMENLLKTYQTLLLTILSRQRDQPLQEKSTPCIL
nr:hypothetical protein Iba_scaffold8496CG0020 [Ipomoea batatas]